MVFFMLRLVPGDRSGQCLPTQAAEEIANMRRKLWVSISPFFRTICQVVREHAAGRLKAARFAAHPHHKSLVG
jgi:hypothetical protein